MGRKLASIALAGAMTIISLCATVGAAQADVVPLDHAIACDIAIASSQTTVYGVNAWRVPGGSYFVPGQSCSEPHNRLIFQTDRKLAVYDQNNGLKWLAPNTYLNGYIAKMQTDGNFVVYNSSYTPLWASNTSGYTAADNVWLAVQADGNVVIYKGYGSSPAALWATNTVHS